MGLWSRLTNKVKKIKKDKPDKPKKPKKNKKGVTLVVRPVISEEWTW